MPVLLSLHDSLWHWLLLSGKISEDPTIEAVKRKDIAQMFIENPQVKGKKNMYLFSSLVCNTSANRKRIEFLSNSRSSLKRLCFIFLISNFISFDSSPLISLPIFFRWVTRSAIATIIENILIQVKVYQRQKREILEMQYLHSSMIQILCLFKEY